MATKGSPHSSIGIFWYGFTAGKGELNTSHPQFIAVIYNFWGHLGRGEDGEASGAGGDFSPDLSLKSNLITHYRLLAINCIAYFSNFAGGISYG